MKRLAPNFYEFFAGGGMARAGLGNNWKCVFANDFDPMKAEVYAANWGRDHFFRRDVAKIKTSDLLGIADLVWASFPCQDLSLAGDYAGLGKAASSVMTRSGTFWPFWALMKDLVKERRAPRLIVLENVYGALTSNSGKDFCAIASALANSNYRFGAVVIDARLFVPQSRPRVFFIAVHVDESVPSHLLADGPKDAWHPQALKKAFSSLTSATSKKWLWWNLSSPPKRNLVFADIIEEAPSDVSWHTSEETKKLLGMMSELNSAKVSSAKKTKKRMVGGVYKRTRQDLAGKKQQRAEVRFDNIAGCLRTPAGGSSRQTILVVEGNKVRSRLLSTREAARLMGLSDDYILPHRYNDAYHVAGDGVCVPVVAYITKNILEPILARKFENHLVAAE